MQVAVGRSGCFDVIPLAVNLYDRLTAVFTSPNIHRKFRLVSRRFGGIFCLYARLGNLCVYGLYRLSALPCEPFFCSEDMSVIFLLNVILIHSVQQIYAVQGEYLSGHGVLRRSVGREVTGRIHIVYKH